MNANTYPTNLYAENSGDYMVRKFDPGCMVFLQWLNNFEFVFSIRPYSDSSPVELLIAFLEPSVLSILVQKVATADVKHLSYNQIICHLEELYSKLRGENAAFQRFLFRDQYLGESVSKYMDTLWKIAEKCNPYVRTNSIIINRVKLGLIDENMRRILYDSENIEFNDALTIAEQLESNNNPN